MAAAVLTVAIAACGSSSDEPAAKPDTGRAVNATAIYEGEGKVAFLAPSVSISIWADAWVPQFTSWMAQVAPNVEVLPYYADFDSAKQLNQAKAAIARGAKVLVVASVDPNQVGALVQYAKQNNVTLLASNRELPNAPLKGYVSDDAVAIGKQLAQWAVDNTKKGDTIATLWGDATDAVYAPVMRGGAKEILDPLAKSGERKIVGDLYTKGYSAQNARREMSAILGQTGNKVAAVISANDDIAAGAASAIQAAGVTGAKVIGSDATISGVQNVLRGRLAMTVYHSVKNQETLAKTAAYVLAGKTPPSGLYSKTVANGKADGTPIEIPYRDDPPVAITEDDVQRLIDDKFLTKTLVCKGLETDVPFCQ